MLVAHLILQTSVQSTMHVKTRLFVHIDEKKKLERQVDNERRGAVEMSNWLDQVVVAFEHVGHQLFLVITRRNDI